MTKTLDSTAVYAYTTLISALVCIPFALIAEGSALQAGAAAAMQKVGHDGAGMMLGPHSEGLAQHAVKCNTQRPPGHSVHTHKA